ncbi:MAG: hypothetical protein COV67_05650 [Nitrospinae bacterium CG11_big_fil_rev_8_21_14_0_20_56_8]|nr:MAG: hypothetical protein COV67_05650 [Nitrospinae bacterium CG11_big_fil_rev_8_21_14_0_20_56_8]
MEDSILQSIRRSGFPEKRVRLLFLPVYRSCKEHGLALADVLRNLEAQDVFGTLEGDHIVFRSSRHLEEGRVSQPGPERARGFFGLPGLGNLESLQQFAREQMAKMPPEQLEQIKKSFDNMSDEEKQNLIQLLARQFKPGS